MAGARECMNEWRLGMCLHVRGVYCAVIAVVYGSGDGSGSGSGSGCCWWCGRCGVLPEDFSMAETSRMPSALMAKVTSICEVRGGWGRVPEEERVGRDG